MFHPPDKKKKKKRKQWLSQLKKRFALMAIANQQERNSFL